MNHDKRNAELEKEIKKLSIKCDDLEQHSRKQMVRLTGVPFTTGEDTDKKIMDIARKIKVIMTPSDIAISHRTGKQVEDRPRPIVARISNHKVKTYLLRNAKYLKSQPELAGISINQELTKLRSTIAYQARKLVRKELLKSTWVVDGKIYIVDNDENKHVIRNYEEFDELLQKLNIVLPPDEDEKEETQPKWSDKKDSDENDDMGDEASASGFGLHS